MDERLLSDRSDEQRPPSSDGEKQPLLAWMGAVVLASVAMILVVAVASCLVDRRPAEYSVTIRGFTGVEDRIPRAFNFTMDIDNLGSTDEVCVGGEAVVLYGGVPLAVGQVQDLCVPRKSAAELDVVAASGGVGVPEALAELMAGEKRATDAAVRVEVRVVMVRHAMMLSCTAPLHQGPGPAPRPCPCKVAGIVDESDGIRPDDKSPNPL